MEFTELSLTSLNSKVVVKRFFLGVNRLSSRRDENSDKRCWGKKFILEITTKENASDTIILEFQKAKEPIACFKISRVN